jgi:hypothetical protein
VTAISSDTLDKSIDYNMHAVPAAVYRFMLLRNASNYPIKSPFVYSYIFCTQN